LLSGLFRGDDRLEDFRNRERLGGAFGLHQNAAVGAHGQRGADGFGGLRGPDRNGDDLRRLAGFLEPERFFDGDFVEGIHRHFDVGKFDAGAVRLDPNLHILVDRPFDGHENLHGLLRLSRSLPAGSDAPGARRCCGAGT
jgi:hypothetical protein